MAGRCFLVPRGIMPHTPLRSDAQFGDARPDPSISAAYAAAGRLRTARLDVKQDNPLFPVPHRGRVMGERRSMLWDGTMGPVMVRREAQARAKGTCPDR